MRLMLVAVLGVIFRTVLRARRLPAVRPATFNGRGAVVCLGASTVQGNMSYNFVDELARRLPDRTFVNAGVNGETSAQVLSRVPEVVACQPTDVIVMAGANDLAAIRGARLAGGRRTTFDEFHANLTAIVRGLRPARVALMSIQPLGEVLDSPENQDMDRLNAIVRGVADAEDVPYLPFNEQMKRPHQRTGRPRSVQGRREEVHPLERLQERVVQEVPPRGERRSAPELVSADPVDGPVMRVVLPEVPGAAGDS